MARCQKCGSKYGLGPFTFFTGGDDNYCPECKPRHDEFIRIVIQRKHSVDSRAEDAAWMAALYLLSAEQVNAHHFTGFIQGVPGILREDVYKESFPVSRACAIRDAQTALSLIGDEPGARQFLEAIIARAESLESSPVTARSIHLPIPPIGIGGGYSLVGMQDAAYVAGRFFVEDWEAFVRTLPGHEWLSGDVRRVPETDD